MVELEPVASDIGYSMTSHKINLKSVEETREEKAKDCLPKGVRAMVVGDRVVFVRRLAGRWMPVPQALQLDLEKKHVIKE